MDVDAVKEFARQAGLAFNEVMPKLVYLCRLRGFLSMAFMFLWFALIYLIFCFVKNKFEADKEDDIGPLIGATVVSSMFVGVVLAFFYQSLLMFIAPEAYTLRSLIP